LPGFTPRNWPRVPSASFPAALTLERISMTTITRRLFTVDETCAIANISRPKFYRLGIPLVHVGNSSRVTAETVDDICAGKFSATPERLKARVAAMARGQASANRTTPKRKRSLEPTI
jgi:hypothetical protein